VIPLVVGKRWNDSVQRGEPCPFDDIGLSSAFTQSHPIERVLKLVGQLLDSRLSAFPNGQDWPTDQSLFCDQNYIIEQVGVLSRFLEHRP
jgi:hypothetical protein